MKDKSISTKDISDKQVCIATKIYREKINYNSNENNKFIYDYLMELTGAPLKVCYRAMERADTRNYIDFGVSLRTAWLTEKGKELLDES